MGSSTVIAHGLLTIVGVILATVFGAFVVTRINYVNNSLSLILNSKLQELQIDVKIITGFYNSSESMYVIYVKNVGSLNIPLTQLYGKTELYLNTYDGQNYFFILGAGGGANEAFVRELVEDGTWSPGETILVKMLFQSKPSEPIKVKLVLPSGAYTEGIVPG
jgi:flagellar protein FlaG